jgi:lysophospholipase L1-like esterase
VLRKEWLLLSGVLLLTLAVSLIILRWLAPQLIGLPVDLRLVTSSEKLPPFFDGVFRQSDYTSDEFLVNDPVTVTRGRPRFPELTNQGPHDVLGFRNREVPVYADIAVIGDSQTYGNNVVLENNWPSRMMESLSDFQSVTYNMASGGWGGVQYLEMATKATTFRPRLLIVAFYTGNDSLESFLVAYKLDRFKDLRPVEALGPADVPVVNFPVPPEEKWAVAFKDGFETVFTPSLRLSSNDDQPAVHAGYGVMANAAREIRRVTLPFGIAVMFTIIPTKEYVFADKIRLDGITPPDKFKRLVEQEGRRIADLAEALRALPSALYVDVTGPLAEAATKGLPVYPSNDNGHPLEAGYAVIANVLAAAARDKLRKRLKGLFAVPIGPNEGALYLVDSDGVWQLPKMELALKNGWSREQIEIVPSRALSGLPRRGTLDVIDPDRFGPDALR